MIEILTLILIFSVGLLVGILGFDDDMTPAEIERFTTTVARYTLAAMVIYLLICIWRSGQG